MVDLEGQDHGPSSSSVGDNDDDFIVYSKEGNNARWFKKEGDEVSHKIYFAKLKLYGLYVDNATVAMECTEEVFLAKIIHGDGAKVIKVGEDIEHKEVERKEFNTLYSVSISHHIHTFQKLQLHKVKGIVQIFFRFIMVSSSVNATTVEDEDDIAKFKDYKPSQSGDSKEAKVPLSKIKGTGSDGTIVQADIEDYLGTSILLLSSSIVHNAFDSNCEREALSLCQIWEELMGSSNSAPSSIPHNLEYLPSDQVIKVEKRVVPGAGPDQYTFAHTCRNPCYSK
ncbi:hypothetical protein Sjap_017935 [Stephania japonica]|uniref:Uncharacterized protein n=1 Tax=Stephania japonica TaxID=461633 RepID=A0AAP0I767_9MAGN